MTTTRRAIPWIGGATVAGVPLVALSWMSVPSVLLVGLPTWTAEALWYSLPGRSRGLYGILTALPYVLVPLAVGGFFIWLCKRIARRPERARTLLVGSLLVMAVLSVLWYVAGWSYGARYQGIGLMTTNLVIGGLAMAAMALIAVAWRTRPTPSLPMLFLWIEFVWILGFAFPWLGETW